MAINSEALSGAFEKNTNPEIRKELDALRGLIDPELFAQFGQRVDKILNENPGSEEIVGGELRKLGLKTELALDTYNKSLEGILGDAANDNLPRISRAYGGTGKPANNNLDNVA